MFVFMDFKKAFDLIDTNNLFSVLKEHCIKAKTYMAVKCLYEIVKTKVRVGGDLTEAFMYNRCVKQGDSYSPIFPPC